MTRIANENDDGGGQPVTVATVKPDAALPNQVQQTLLQVGICLNMVASLTPHVLRLGDAKESDNPAADGGVIMAAENTFCKVCNVLDSILDDKPRWTLDQLNAVETARIAMYEAEAARSNEHQRALKQLARPSQILRPTVGYVDGMGFWLASYGGTEGDVRNGDHEPLTGIGVTPEEALKDFDTNFTKAFAEGKVNLSDLGEAAEKSEKLFRRDLTPDLPGETEREMQDGAEKNKRSRKKSDV